MPLPFEVTFDEVQANLATYVDELFSCLESAFLVMPKGPGFVEYPTFETGYEALKQATTGFQNVTPETVTPVVFDIPISLIVLHCMLGFTPPEWAHYAPQQTGIEITQGSEFNPQIVIKAKLTEDDGTAHDKITHIQHLRALSMDGQPSDQPKFEVIACIAGCGFGVRREDMKELLLATRGQVFTLQNMQQLVEGTRLKEFRSR